MKYTILLFIFFFSFNILFAQTEEEKVLFQAMEDEMERSKDMMLPGMDKPFFMTYSSNISSQFEVAASLGAVTSWYYAPSTAVASVKLLLGNYEYTSDTQYAGAGLRSGLPQEVDYDHIRRSFWMITDAAYKRGVQEQAMKDSYLKSNPRTEEEKSLKDLNPIEPITKIIDSKESYTIDQNKLESLARELSAIFKNYNQIYNSSVVIGGFDANVYKITSEGTKIKQPMRYVQLIAQGQVLTDDGVYIGDSYSVLVLRPEELPSTDELKKKITEFADNLIKLKDAPIVHEYYSGPILFEDGASAAILTGNLLAPARLFAIRKGDNAQSQAPKTLEDRIGRKIVDNRISVKNYTTLDKYNGTHLVGQYEIDAEGVIPEKEMTLVDKGILKMILNGRVPTLKSQESTGSSKFMITNTDIAHVIAPGTIHFEIDKGTKPDKMKKALIKAAKDEGLDYGYIIKKLAGPASLIYKVDVKDGSETLVRFADLSNIDLQKIKRVLNISSKENVSNYVLNRQVLSSMIYPSSILLEDIELNKSEPKKEKKPSVTFPLQR